MPYTQEDWKTVLPALEAAKADGPRVSKLVKVVKGRKHVGEYGRVTWHGKDKYYDGWRYMSGMQVALADAIGRIGYRVRVQVESGESFFVNADYVEVIKES